MRFAGGSVKRSLAMALLGRGATIAKACGLDAATRFDYRFCVVRPPPRVCRMTGPSEKMQECL